MPCPTRRGRRHETMVRHVGDRSRPSRHRRRPCRPDLRLRLQPRGLAHDDPRLRVRRPAAAVGSGGRPRPPAGVGAAKKPRGGEKRLTVFTRPLGEPPPPPGEPPRGTPLECVVTGVDKAGIVARVAATIPEQGANILDLHTDLRPEPESGTAMYTMRVRLVVPPDRDVRALRQALERVAAELRVDLSV